MQRIAVPMIGGMVSSTVLTLIVMMWGMGLIGLLIIIVLALGAAALVKYLFFTKGR
jgi:Cu/Ag efflux pump CusA